MARLVSRLATPASTLLLGLLAGCASNNMGGGGTSGTSSGATSGATSGTASGTSSGSGSASGGNCMYAPQPKNPPDAAVADPAAYCKVPVPASCATLPFTVDTIYVPSGWMGDAPMYAAVPA